MSFALLAFILTVIAINIPVIAVIIVRALMGSTQNDAAWHEHQRSRRFFDRW